MERMEIPTLCITGSWITSDSLRGYRVPVLPNQTASVPAHLIMPELIPLTLVIDPESGTKDQKKDETLL